MEKLRKCAFCKSDQVWVEGMTDVFVHCDNCNVTVNHLPGSCDDYSDAIAFYNRWAEQS